MPWKSLSLVKDQNLIRLIWTLRTLSWRKSSICHLHSTVMSFILPHVDTRVLNSYGKSMDGMDKIHDGHARCRTKKTNIRNEFGLIFQRSWYVGYLLWALTHFVRIFHGMVEITIVPNGLELHQLHLQLKRSHLRDLRFNARYVVPLLFVLLVVVQ